MTMPLDLEMHSMTDTNFAEMPGNFSGVKKGSPMYAYCSPTFENNSENALFPGRTDRVGEISAWRDASSCAASSSRDPFRILSCSPCGTLETNFRNFNRSASERLRPRKSRVRSSGANTGAGNRNGNVNGFSPFTYDT